MKSTKNGSRVIFTLGYEGRSASDVFTCLSEAGVGVLLDVRYRPLSRKPGLSKTRLSEACSNHGIEYIHDRDLGTPPDILKEVRRRGYDAKIGAMYRAFLKGKEESLRSAADLARDRLTCLLCYESKPQECHRRVVAEELALRNGFTVQHL